MLQPCMSKRLMTLSTISHVTCFRIHGKDLNCHINRTNNHLELWRSFISKIKSYTFLNSLMWFVSHLLITISDVRHVIFSRKEGDSVPAGLWNTVESMLVVCQQKKLMNQWHRYSVAPLDSIMKCLP
jgi:hypothetical protein